MRRHALFGSRLASKLQRSRTSGGPLLFHTQTVHWRRTADVDDGDAAAAAVERRPCRLVTFRPPDHPTNDPPTALTVDDATRSAWALRRLREGRALVYDGGDYRNARQLLRAVRRRIAAGGASGRPETKRRRNETRIRAEEKEIGGADDVFDVGKEWTRQRESQRERAAIAHGILIRASLEGDRGPSGILGLKRAPTNAGDVFAYAFQNDKELVAKLDDGDPTTSSSRSRSCVLVSLVEFLAMVGGYEWNRRGVHVHALGGRVVPHFGVFPPTRQDYLHLLDRVAIERATRGGSPVRMMEVGIGSGVLSLILLRRKTVDRVIGTDVNPYAVACTRENMARFGFEADVMLADLFPPEETPAIRNEGEGDGRVDVVLFNPPWVPGDAATWLDKSVYDPGQGILRRFLSQVQHHVKKDGQVYLLLSNLGVLLGLFQEQDLYDMFDEGNLELVEVHMTESKKEMAKGESDIESEREAQFDLLESVKSREVVSLYHLRVRNGSQR